MGKGKAIIKKAAKGGGRGGQVKSGSGKSGGGKGC